MSEQQLGWLHTRLRVALSAIQRLDLMDTSWIAGDASPCACHIMDRTILLCLAVLANNHIAQLTGFNNFLVSPLHSARKQNSRSQLCDAVSEWLPDSRYFNYEHENIPLRLQKLLLERQDCMVHVSLSNASNDGFVRASWTERVTQKELEAFKYPARWPQLFGMSRQGEGAVQAKGKSQSNAFGALDVEGEEEEDANDDALQAELLREQRRETAATLFQALWRAHVGRKRSKKRKE